EPRRKPRGSRVGLALFPSDDARAGYAQVGSISRAVAGDPCAIAVSVFADPVKAGAAPLGDLDQVRGGTGLPGKRSGQRSGYRHRHCDQTDKCQYRYTHVVLPWVTTYHITCTGCAIEYRSSFAERRNA